MPFSALRPLINVRSGMLCVTFLLWHSEPKKEKQENSHINVGGNVDCCSFAQFASFRRTADQLPVPEINTLLDSGQEVMTEFNHYGQTSWIYAGGHRPLVWRAIFLHLLLSAKMKTDLLVFISEPDFRDPNWRINVCQLPLPSQESFLLHWTLFLVRVARLFHGSEGRSPLHGQHVLMLISFSKRINDWCNKWTGVWCVMSSLQGFICLDYHLGVQKRHVPFARFGYVRSTFGFLVRVNKCAEATEQT